MGSSSGKKHKKDKKHSRRSRSHERQNRSVEDEVTLDLTDDSSSTRHRHHKHKKHKEHRHKHHKHKESREPRPSEVISLEESDSDSKCSQQASIYICRARAAHSTRGNCVPGEQFDHKRKAMVSKWFSTETAVQLPWCCTVSGRNSLKSCCSLLFCRWAETVSMCVYV